MLESGVASHALLGLLLAAPAAASGWPGAEGTRAFRAAERAREALGVDAGFERVFRDDGAPAPEQAAESLDPARLRVTGQRVYTLIGGQPGAPDYELTLLVDQRGPWAGALGRAKLREGLLESAAIFARCGVNLRRAHVVETWLDDALRDSFDPGAINPYLPPPEVAVATRVAVPARPLVLALEKGSTRAFHKPAVERFVRQHPENRHLLDVATLSWSIARDYDERFFVQPSYSLLAHELAHLLGDFGHVVSPVPNLMNSYEGSSPREAGLAKSGDLLPEQCAAIASYASRRSPSALAAPSEPLPPLTKRELLELLRSLEH